MAILIGYATNWAIEVDFGSYRNESEKKLIEDTHVNWVRTDAQNAYVCQGQKVKRDHFLLNLLPKKGLFMITYLYARPKLSQTLIADLVIYPLSLPTFNGYVDFTFSQDSKTTLRLIVIYTDINVKQIIWENYAKTDTKKVVAGRAWLKNVKSRFNLVFQAEVNYQYPYLFRTYLSQVVVERVVLKST